MKNLLIVLILGAVVWSGYNHFKGPRAQPAAAESFASASPPASPSLPVGSSPAKCDGRTHCSQMRSCTEATYFLQHCPNTEMDGDGDGVPCERQWCQ
ncbi:excalibur calcium-binding domain-containing protein [Luteimonas vadosa]|uniref:excalibur calcium-binding domain-containing protein n=1 Tax=Luteimonas vadosa TaxID=1165507 RepID=UPI0031ECB4D5